MTRKLARRALRATARLIDQKRASLANRAGAVRRDMDDRALFAAVYSLAASSDTQTATAIYDHLNATDPERLRPVVAGMREQYDRAMAQAARTPSVRARIKHGLAAAARKALELAGVLPKGKP